MNSKERILRAFEAKGYPREHISIYWEHVRYYDTGREGGWEITLDDEELELESNWGEEVKPCLPGSKDVFTISFGFILAYSVPVVLQIIEQLKPYPLVEYYRRQGKLEPVNSFQELKDGDNLAIVGELNGRNEHVFREIRKKDTRQDGHEVILDPKPNYYFNFELYSAGTSWVKECYRLLA